MNKTFRNWAICFFAFSITLVWSFLARQKAPAPISEIEVPTKVFRPPSAFLTPSPEDPKPPLSPETRKCLPAYARLYERNTVDIRVVFGYKDARPTRYVGDRYEKSIFVTYLLAPCSAGWFACGFNRELSDPELFRKNIAGPDGLPRDIRLRVVNSSVGPDDDANRVDGFQKWQSHRAQQVWEEGIAMADVVFYDGHSRDGGGPDFGPPRLSAARHVDYDWYVREKPGMKVLLQKLANPADRLQVLGLFSCASKGHFLKELQELRPKIATITSPRLIYYTDALRNLLGGLSALLGCKCSSDFSLALHMKAEVGSSNLTGFFSKY